MRRPLNSSAMVQINSARLDQSEILLVHIPRSEDLEVCVIYPQELR